MDFALLVLTLRAAGCVFAEDEARLLLEAASGATSDATTVDQERLEALVARRVSGVPLEHLLGWAEFAGIRVLVDDGVFVPRRRTEFLANRAIELAVEHAHPVVLDLCCGSGAIGLALRESLLSRGRAPEIYAADIDPAAVSTARRNLPPPAVVVCGDLFEPLPDGLRGRVDVLVCNTPYVPTDAIGTMPPEARLFEARLALDGGHDGLDVQRRVAAAASEWLAPGGHVLVEAGAEQAPESLAVFERAQLESRIEYSDFFDTSIVVSTKARQVSPWSSGTA
jgi:release factor glutamine methyltransferase